MVCETFNRLMAHVYLHSSIIQTFTQRIIGMRNNDFYSLLSFGSAEATAVTDLFSTPVTAFTDS